MGNHKQKNNFFINLSKFTRFNIIKIKPGFPILYLWNKVDENN